MSNKEFQEFLRGSGHLPSRGTYAEAINPDSLEDAFEVEDDGIENIFNMLLGRQ